MAGAEAKKQDLPPEDSKPMFFEKPVPLDKQRHAKAGCVPSKNFSFAMETNSIPVNVVEFIEAAKAYPIVFTEAENPQPVIIVGLEQRNYFVSDKGGWHKHAYMPAYVRKYPFVFMQVPEKDQLLLCVDEASPQFKKKISKDVLPFFDGDNPSDTAKSALEFCSAFHNHHNATVAFSKGLADAGLLMPNASNVKLFNDRTVRLGGFQIIDEKKFNALPDETILEFKKKGWLPFIYFALLSMSNWKKLADLAAEFEPRQ